MLGSTKRRGRGAALTAASLTAGMIMTFLPAASSGAATNVTFQAAAAGPINTALVLPLLYGYFAQEGLNVTQDLVPGGAAVSLAGLDGGQFQFAFTGFQGVITADQAGGDIVSIAGMHQGATHLDFLFSKPFVAANSLTTKTPWQTVLTDMKGQSFAVQSLGGTLGIDAKALLNQAGLPANWMNFVAISSESGTDAAIASNQVQGTIFQFPGSQEIPANGDAVDLFPLSVVPLFKHTMDAALLTTPKYAAANPSIVKKMAKGVAWGDNLLSNPATRPAALKALEICFPQFSTKVLGAQVPANEVLKNGAQPPSVIANTALVQYDVGALKVQDTPAQVQALFTNAYLPKTTVKPVLPPKKFWQLHNSADC